MAVVLDLQVHIEKLIAWLAQSRPIPSWNEQLIVDTSDPRVRWVSGDEAGWRLPRDVLQQVDSFAPRFDQLLRKGYPWLNLSAYGLYAGDLVFGIELPGESSNVPIGYTSVNYSGPAQDLETGGPHWVAPLKLVES